MVRNPLWFKVFCLACSIASWQSHADEAPAPEKITLYYEDRIPYIIPVMGEGIIGFIASRVTSVLDDANIRYDWNLLPFQTQQEVLRRNRAPGCALGIYKTQAREKYLLFSKPIYQNRPLVIFANTKSDFSKYKNLASLLGDKQKRLLLKLGYTYGDQFDHLIKQANATRNYSDKRNVGMIREILDGDYDYLIGAPEELETLVKLMDLTSNEFQFLNFPDMPEGESRHIACSLQVGQGTMDKINASIDKLSKDWNKTY